MGDTKHPTVSVGLPVYNGEIYLREALDSVLGQTFEDFELVITDNASTDKTEAICREYAQRDQRIRYHRSEVNLGAAPNYNRIVPLARGRYFRWAAHDDSIRPSYLERCVEALENDPSCVLAYPKTIIIDQQGREMRKHEDKLELLDEYPHERLETFMRLYYPNFRRCNAVFGLVRTETLRQTRLIGSYANADVNLLGELALRGKFYEVPEHLFLRRLHPKASVRAHNRLDARAVWFDAANRGKVLFPRWRSMLEYLSSLRRVRLGAAEKMRCYGVFVRVFMRWSIGPLVADVLRAGKATMLGGR